MPGYWFKAMDAQGRLIRNRMDANNVDDLENRLLKIQMDLVNFREIRGGGAKIFDGRITRQDMITFCFHLEQVMGSGVPLIEGLGDLRDSSDNPGMRSMLASLVEDVATGSQLSESMDRFPKVFDEVFRALIRAGEQTGNLQEIFSNLAETIKWQDELTSKTKKLLMYPAFVFTIVVGVFFFMMTFLVPQLVTFIKMMGMALPFHTQLLIDTSDFVVHWWPFMLGIPIGLGFLIYSALKVSPMMEYLLDWMKLHAFVFGPIIQKIIMARFSNVFAMMYAAGITVMECLVISEKVVGNKVVGRVIIEARDRISQGETISSGFKQTMIFPALVIRMLSVGETTGALDKSLMNVRYFYDREVKDSVEKLQGMIEPVLTLFLGGLMAWIILSVLGPIYDIMNKVGH
ncbi:MAG: type II secretion system F family protein [Nitrospirae bacterium]|nr:type II secretion system F family protein [Magnetococcales bacterium]HAT49135.1 type II secretion system F family protein [Alphaproteobacteria bacterium]